MFGRRPVLNREAGAERVSSGVRLPWINFSRNFEDAARLQSDVFVGSEIIVHAQIP